MSRLDELILELCPNGVEYKQLKDLGVFYGGLTGKSKDDFENGNKIFITYKNVYSNPSLDLHPAERVKIGETENQRTLKYGDVIFTGSSETPDECGISSVVTEIPQDDLYLNSFCFIFRFDDLNGIYPPFMKHLFRSSSIRKQIGRTANGICIQNDVCHAFGEYHIWLHIVGVGCGYCFRCNIFTLLWCYSKCN